MATLSDLQSGLVQAVAPQSPQRQVPNEVEWWDINSSLNQSTFGFPDNFDTSNNFILPFYVDKNVKQVVEVGLTLYFQPFKGYTKPTSHSHSVTIPGHDHTVTIPNHQHNVTLGDHTHSVPGSSHSHGWSLNISSGNGGNDVRQAYFANGVSTVSLWSNNASTSGTIGGVSTNSTTPSSVTSGGGGGTTVASASGGGTTPTTSTTSSTPSTSGTAAGAEYGIFTDTYAQAVNVLLDGTNVTANLGGPWTPSSSNTTVADLDLTGFFHPSQGIVEAPGLHVLELTTTQRGRAIPLLWVKSIISR